MIYTVTFNPALDYVARVEHFIAGAVNRTVEEHIFYGGKGINVSAVLANLGYDSTALGFVAGFTGDAIEKGVAEQGIETDFVHLDNGFSRINVKIKSGNTALPCTETELNGQGPEIDSKALDLLFDK